MTRQTSRREIKAVYTTIQTLLRSGIGTREKRKDAQRRLEALQGDLAYLIGDRGFEEFFEERLEHYRRNSEKSLCSCWRATCPLKRGEVPPKLRQHGAGTIRERRPPSELLVEFLNHHDGGEVVELIRREWAQLAVRVDLELSDIRTELKRRQTREEVARNLGVEYATNDETATEAD